MILADLTIDGAPRKVILHAPKNGFFFVIDRTNGKFISAKNFVDVNWATGYDANGRPIEVAEARSPDKSFDSIPGPYGAHNWHPMSFNPGTGLVYLPAQNVPVNLTGQTDWSHNGNKPGEFAGNLGWNTGFALNATPPKSLPFGRLIAWDPVKQKETWRQEHVSPWNGGTLTTAGNLVFQGTADGRFIAYNATSGEKLWESPTGTGVVAAASTYLVDGEQYVSVAVGWGGVYGVAMRATELNSPGTVYTFAVGGKAPLPAFTKYQTENLLSGVKYDPADVGPGTLLYVSNCAICHGVPGVDKGGNVRNLAYVGADTITNLKDHRLQRRIQITGHAGFHRQAEGRGCDQDHRVHSRSRRFGPAEGASCGGIEIEVRVSRSYLRPSSFRKRCTHSGPGRRRAVRGRRRLQAISSREREPVVALLLQAARGHRDLGHGDRRHALLRRPRRRARPARSRDIRGTPAAARDGSSSSRPRGTGRGRRSAK